MDKENSISIIASISVKSLDEIKQFVKSWSIYLNSKIDLIVCVNDICGFINNYKYVKIVEFNDNKGMFEFRIQQKKYFAAKNSNSDYMLFIHERIIPDNVNFFTNLLGFIKSNDFDYFTFVIKNIDNSISLPKIYLDLSSNLKQDFFSYLTNLNKSRGCLFKSNSIPSINGAAFLLKKERINLLDNNYRWGEMEDLKLTFDLFSNNFQGLIYEDNFLLTKVFKPRLKETNKLVLFVHRVFKIIYFPLFLFSKINTVYSNINFQMNLALIHQKKNFFLIDLLHKPFHTTIYKNSLEKILTAFRSLDENIELKVERKFFGFIISINE